MDTQLAVTKPMLGFAVRNCPTVRVCRQSTCLAHHSPCIFLQSHTNCQLRLHCALRDLDNKRTFPPAGSTFETVMLEKERQALGMENDPHPQQHK